MPNLDQPCVLLTGGTGFLGSAIVKKLLAENYKVLVLKRSFSGTRRIDPLLKDGRITFFDADTSDPEKCFEDRHINFVIHAATVYGRSGESVADIVSANFIFPIKLLDAAIRYGAEVFINTDTFSNEDIELAGNEKQYVRTKKDFVKYAKDMVAGRKIKLVNLVMEQIYGPDDNPTKFIPFIVKEILRGASEIPLTSGEQERDFVYVEDCAASYAAVLRHADDLGEFEEFGIGAGIGRSLRSAVETIKNTIGGPSILEWGKLPYRKNEIMHRAADVSKNAKIGWSAGHTFNEGIEKVIEFYRRRNA